MPHQRSPDTALLAVGWERNAETDEYRPPPDHAQWMRWLSHGEARAIAFPSDEAEEVPIVTETTMIALLGDILTELKQINATLGRKALP